MSGSEPQLLAYERPPEEGSSTGGVVVADHGDHLIITGPQPRPLKVVTIVLWALFVAAQIGWTAYSTGRRSSGWQFSPAVAFLTLLSTGAWTVQCVAIWRVRRPRVTEITPDGVSLTDHFTLSGHAHYPRSHIRRLHLVHGETDKDGFPVCTLRLVLRRRRGDLAWLFPDPDVVILTGPAAHLREIGDRVRQVLDHPA